jgi:hypothetical protein
VHSQFQTALHWRIIPALVWLDPFSLQSLQSRLEASDWQFDFLVPLFPNEQLVCDGRCCGLLLVLDPVVVAHFDEEDDLGQKFQLHPVAQLDLPDHHQLVQQLQEENALGGLLLADLLEPQIVFFNYSSDDESKSKGKYPSPVSTSTLSVSSLLPLSTLSRTPPM